MPPKEPANQLESLRAMAAQALRRYGIDRAKLVVLANQHNATFRVETRSGTRFILKLNQPSYGTIEQVRSEMQWLDALNRDTDLLVPKPIRDRSGELVGPIGQGPLLRWHRLTTWVPGRRLARGMKVKHFEQLGGLLASMQDHAASFTPPPGFTRARFGKKRIRSRMDKIRQAHNEGRLTSGQIDFFERAAERAEMAMTQLGEGRAVFGLIHGDLGYGNYLFHQGRPGAIDFEVCGYGHFLEDLVEPVHFAQHVSHFPRICCDVLRGYRQVRRLDDEMIQYFPAFIDAAAVTTCGYIAGEPSRKSHLSQFARYFTKYLPKRRPGLLHALKSVA